MSGYNYLDRDISWLSFNDRVIDQTNKGIPVAEQLQFIGISASNLDEFFKVRLASRLKNVDEHSKLVEGCKKQLKTIEEDFKFINKQGYLTKFGTLSKERREVFSKIFKDQVYPILTPIKITDTILAKDSVSYLIVAGEKKGKESLYTIEIPNNISRFVIAKNRMILLEDLIANHLDDMLKGIKINDVGVFRALRNSETVFNDNEDVFDMINKSLKDREKSSIIRLDFSGSYSLYDKLASKLSAVEAFINMCEYVDLSMLKKFDDCLVSKEDKYRKHSGTHPFSRNKTIFEIIDDGDRLVHHPYESFEDSVVRFIKESANSKYVKSIKITLYRVTEKSKIVDALLEAADSGKSVTVFVELKARFDEKNNIKVSKILKEAGVNIIFGVAKIKTHCKICIVTYKNEGKVKTYSHIGTGNYNESNSKIYTDYSYFTCDNKIGWDLTRFFNLLTSDQENFKSKEIIYAPYNLRDEINTLIEEEMKKAKKDKPSRIIIKCNNLTDEKICNKLNQAAEAGVKIICIVRSACILQPSKNIRIYSIVGRFLEHSRIYLFGKKDPTVLIGSSDLMYRNLDLRNEILINIESKKLKNDILRDISFYMRDTYNSYIIEEDYKFKKKKGKQFDAHSRFIKDAK